jgi:hypothetical protein
MRTTVDLAGAIIGHMIGDYLLQNDWMAERKLRSSWVCALHAGLWTLAVCVCGSIESAAAWAWLLGSHWAIDRFQLAGKSMDYLGKRNFKSQMAPWSIIIVDNTWHLATILVVARLPASL